MSKDLRPLLNGVQDNKSHWLELAQTAQETKKNRKNSLKSMSNGSINNNNNYYTNGNGNKNSNNNHNNNCNNNNGDELSNTSNDSIKMSKIVGKFPLDITGITTSIFSPTFIKPSQNGFINSYKAPAIVRYENWKKQDTEEVMDQ